MVTVRFVPNDDDSPTNVEIVPNKPYALVGDWELISTTFGMYSGREALYFTWRRVVEFYEGD